MKLKICVISILLGISFSVISQDKSNLKFNEGLAPHKQYVAREGDTLIGFVNTKGILIIGHRYDTIYRPFKNGFAVVGLMGKTGLINKRGKEIIPVEYDEIGEIQKGLIPVKNFAGLWGFFTLKGSQVTPLEFDNFRFTNQKKIIAQKYKKWGLIDDNGKQLLEYAFRDLEHVSGKLYRAYRLNSWSVKDFNNTTSLFFYADTVQPGGSNFYKYTVAGKTGLVDVKGEVITRPDYESLSHFRFGKIVAIKNGMYGVLDKEGKAIIDFDFADIKIDSLTIRVKILDEKGKSRWGVYDHFGNRIIRPAYPDMDCMSEGMIGVKSENKLWGFIDRTGKTIVPPAYKEVGTFKDGLAFVKTAEGNAIINKAGEFVVTPSQYSFVEAGIIKFRSGKKELQFPIENYTSASKAGAQSFVVESKGKFGAVDKTGKIIIPIIYDEVIFSDANFVLRKEKKYAVADEKGNLTINLTDKFERIFPFSEGMAKMLKNGSYGYIDALGNVWISPQYQYAGDFSEGLVAVMLKGKWGYLNKNEEIKVQPYYEKAFPFKNGLAIIVENGKYNLVDKTGKELFSNGFQYISNTSSERYLLKEGGNFGLADQQGREVIPPRYDYLEELGNGFVLVEREGSWGVLDYTGLIVIPLEYESIFYDRQNNVVVAGKKGKYETVTVK